MKLFFSVLFLSITALNLDAMQENNNNHANASQCPNFDIVIDNGDVKTYENKSVRNIHYVKKRCVLSINKETGIKTLTRIIDENKLSISSSNELPEEIKKFLEQ